ncbi:transposase [Arcicella rosea]|uniref:REP element-mobilizing transposase RayT n=1 Tax=Arcicella rosea TaxID=502909 RepID=A0A841EL30_9BACT|nr:transposase [Arcicella rosea]MBB6002109.1 REP element-mobilizing transposase RayT [Arcicella rosea]
MQYSSMQIGVPYFYTATILNWQKLLKPDKYKDIIISSLQHLVAQQKIKVFAFVIMPNHIHLIWTMLAKNGKEMPNASFMKYTGHRFLEDLSLNHPKVLSYFEVECTNRKYHFWQRNSLPIALYSPTVWQQKIDYIHNNPVVEKWNLADLPENYRYSSAKFYEHGIDEFGILSHWQE